MLFYGEGLLTLPAAAAVPLPKSCTMGTLSQDPCSVPDLSYEHLLGQQKGACEVAGTSPCVCGSQGGDSQVLTTPILSPWQSLQS